LNEQVELVAQAYLELKALADAQAVCPTCSFDATPTTCVACMSHVTAGDRMCTVCGREQEGQAPAATTTTLDFSLDGKREALTLIRAQELFAPYSRGQQPTSLCLSTKSFGKDASQVAQSVLSTFRKVEQANLSDIIAGRPTDEALLVLQHLCEALLNSPLRQVNLSDNALGERGIWILIPFFTKIAPTIQTLWFRNNGLSELSLKLLVQVLKECKQLQGLHFESNISCDGGAQAMQE
jgi:Ran GTPase-activating protein 1